MGGGMLLVCSNKNTAQQLTAMISSVLPGIHSTAFSGAQARRQITLTDYSVVLIAGRLSDETAPRLAAELSYENVCPVVIIVDSAEVDVAHDILEGLNTTILTKPIKKDTLLNTVRLAAKLGSGEGGIFEKAKLKLVQQKGFTEPQAHRYIQKISMEKRLPRDVTAQMIIKALERELKEDN